MKRNRFLPAFLFTLLLAFNARAVSLSDAKIVVLNPQNKTESKAAAMLHDEIEKRTRLGLEIAPVLPGAEGVVLLIGTEAELAAQSYRPPAGYEVPKPADGFAIWVDASRRKSPTVCVAGRDVRGVLFGAGRLLRLLDMGRDQARLADDTRLATAPRFPLRGHQFGFRPKTNAYDGWTLAMWEQYYRDMIVFGMNAVELIPPRSDDDVDSPHFPKPPMEMMIAMSQLADDYGLEVWIWYPMMDRDYSDPKTIEFALKERDEVFKKLPRIDAVFIPGGDPGDTRPDYLLDFVEQTKKVLNRSHPNAQIWVSPQGLDRPSVPHRKGWLKLFCDRLQTQQPAWLDGVVFGPQVEATLARLRSEIPARYTIRQYPDITHCKDCQYPVPDWDPAWSNTEGREPINPRPVFYAKIFREMQPNSDRFIAYSEGCNDDFNKVLWLCLGWNPDSEVDAITREYSRYFISDRYEKRFARGLLSLEQDWSGPLLANERVEPTLKLFQQMESEATPQEKLNWRFQEGLYRAYYDAYTRRRLIYETKLEQEAVAELRNAKRVGSPLAMSQADQILDRAVTEKTATDLRARVFELAEALFQSIHMQLSVPRYQAIAVRRGANLDDIDKPLNHAAEFRQRFAEIRRLASEKQRLDALAQMVQTGPGQISSDVTPK